MRGKSYNTWFFKAACKVWLQKGHDVEETGSYNVAVLPGLVLATLTDDRQ